MPDGTLKLPQKPLREPQATTPTRRVALLRSAIAQVSMLHNTLDSRYEVCGCCGLRKYANNDERTMAVRLSRQIERLRSEEALLLHSASIPPAERE